MAVARSTGLTFSDSPTSSRRYLASFSLWTRPLTRRSSAPERASERQFPPGTPQHPQGQTREATSLPRRSLQFRESALDLLDARTSRPQDRKSTRLNSSHGYISYAVFCLKKKKTQDKTLTPIYMN